MLMLITAKFEIIHLVVSSSAGRLKRKMSPSSLQFLIITWLVIDFVTASANDSLNKCCKLNQVYDLSNRECISASNYTHKELIFGSLAYFGAPKCDEDSVMVELDSAKFAIHLAGNILLMPAYENEHEITDWIMSSFCVDDVASTSEQWMAKACRPLSVCDHIPCVPKCCGDGEKIYRFDSDSASTCVSHSKGIQPKFHHITDEAIVERTSEVFGVLHAGKCSKFQLQPDVFEEDAHHLDVVSGRLYKPTEKQWFKHSDYCIEVYADEEAGTEEMTTFVCFGEVKIDTNWSKIVMFLISVFFLGLTLVSFFFLPLSLNVQKISMIHYVACLFVGYLFLSITWLVVIEGLFCKLVGFLIYLGFIAAFSWLSVMCFDMWLSSRRTSPNFAAGFRKLSVFSMYAWGVPAVLFVVTNLMDTFSAIDDKYLPNMGITTCWFHTKTAVLIYFLTPAGIMIGANCVLCFLTICNYKNISKRSSSTGKNATLEHFGIFTYCKIVFVMGVPWLFEILSAIFSEPKQLWAVTDMINYLQGLFIFIVFVLNRRVLADLKGKCGCGRNVPLDAAAMSMTDLEQRTDA